MRPLQKDPKDFSLGYIQFILARCFPFFLCFSIKILGLQRDCWATKQGQFVKGSLCPINRLFSFNVFPLTFCQAYVNVCAHVYTHHNHIQRSIIH